MSAKSQSCAETLVKFYNSKVIVTISTTYLTEYINLESFSIFLCHFIVVVVQTFKLRILLTLQENPVLPGNTKVNPQELLQGAAARKPDLSQPTHNEQINGHDITDHTGKRSQCRIKKLIPCN